MNPLRERRLLHVLAKQLGFSSSADAEKTAKLAAANQNNNADTKGTRIGSNPNADYVENNVGVNVSPDDWAKMTPAEQARHNEGLRLADAGLYVQAPGYNPAKPIVDAANPQPKTAPEETGVIDNAAIKRLMDSGMTREQALERIRSLRPQIQDTMNKIGTEDSLDSQGAYVPVPRPQQPGSAERTAGINLRKKISDLSRPLTKNDVQPEYDSKGRMTKTAEQVAAERNAARAAEATELQRQLTEMQKRQMEKNAATVATGATAGLPPSAAPGATQADPNAPAAVSGAPAAPADPNAPPSVPTEPDMTGADQAVDNAALIRDERLKNIDAALPGELDKEDAEQQALDAYEKQLDAADAQEKVDKERALEKERTELAINDRAFELQQIENTKAQYDQIALNTENEVKNRRQINKLSGGHDFSGLQWVTRQTQKGLDTLNYLRDKAANMQGVWADRTISIINTLGLELKQAEATKKSTYAADYKEYTTRLDDIRKELKLDGIEKRKLRDAAHKDYADVLTKRDFEYGDYMNQLRLKAIDQETTVWKTMQQAHQNDVTNAIKMLAMSTKKGITFSPAAMAAFERSVAPSLPPGWFRKVIASGGGGGGGGIGGIGGGGPATPDETLEAITAWVNVDPGRRDITQLGKADIAMIVSVWKARKAPQPVGSADTSGGFKVIQGGKVPALKGDHAPMSQPGTPAAFGSAPTQNISNDKRVYDELLASDPNLKGQLSFAEYLAAKQNYTLDQKIKNSAPNPSAPVPSDDDASMDDFINENNPPLD